MDTKLFELALAIVNGRKAELARRCGVTQQTIQNWKVLEDDDLPVAARRKLKIVISGKTV